ncbi:helix-turn-helix domain-containing protein [Roseomonas elaeocarpi]|uniref:Helix-turn-helix domain-containing protein n=1 Tax=Roseomonas elaeocarpi TaxID=907779 RepID=A0ABV6JZY5_9PROT
MPAGLENGTPGEGRGADSKAAAVSRLLPGARGTLGEDRDRADAIVHLSQGCTLLDGGRGDWCGDLPPAVPGGLARWQLRRLLQFIDAQLSRTILLEELAAQARLSSGHFARAFKRSFGTTACRYVVSRRVLRAKLLMLVTHDPLSDIALACGLADQAHLSRLFRHATGTTPMAWRREHQAARLDRPVPRRSRGASPHRPDGDASARNGRNGAGQRAGDGCPAP